MVILPAIDLRDGRCVRLCQGDFTRETVYDGDPAAVAESWRDGGAEWVHLVDLDGARTGQVRNGAVIQAVAQLPGLRCQLGGGLRTEADLEAAFAWGVERAVVGTQALRDPAWLCRMAERFPGRLVLGLDAQNGLVATDGWLDISSTPALELARRFDHLPLAGIVYTDIHRDGMLTGPNLEATAALVEAVALPVFASGGIGNQEHIRALVPLRVAGCIVGRALHERRFTLADALAAAASPLNSKPATSAAALRH
ncbi:MAG TPA: 1-(5-phosphoribosyl)-5-[(5-phosphoribosylamino)methylideneamino]imidazole-4-carboxamide isomerase [Gemmatales bacterium]|nr:1-(5-phosphoribosyl)-5-[(5-phosphoribosylamino)methylideneamino]imidazole-4-carboxamide isomerase [Gemmatales bacterium]HMP57910.1 1-(5-phosphoribosyl)-5-[(5-phosphoribosylamino)methylideneamino]imidazole-4-carboxamide isomerase [Gemmatales bacterium]